MSLAGHENDSVVARNTSWGGSSNTSWGGSSNTSWGGSSNTSWGGSSNTSWGGGRGRAAMTALAVVLPLLAVLPFARPAHTERVVVVGAHASQALHSVGASNVSLLTDGVAVGRTSTSASASLRASGYRVAADTPVHLDAVPAPQMSSGGRYNVRELANATFLGGGYGQTIAVLDSGVNAVPGLAGRVIQGADFTGTTMNDDYGHGTFVASLAAGNGRAADGTYTGIQGVAPYARIVSVKVADGYGRSSVSRVVAGLAWVLQHRVQYGITVVNLSLSEATASSYLTDPVDALAEAAYFSGMTVVASAGNDGSDHTVTAAPGNDPFVLTVGAVVDANTLSKDDDTLAPYSNNGSTPDGYAKPEISTFGTHVQAALPDGSYLAGKQDATIASSLPAGYGQMSGTSMSSGVAAGAAAILRSLHPSWTPAQVKGTMAATSTGAMHELRLMTAAMSAPTTANVGVPPSLALAVAYAQKVLNTTAYNTVVWSNVVWSDVVWSDVVWSDVVWSDVAGAVGTAATWSDATWSNATWSNAVWSDAVWSDATWSDAIWSTGVSTNATWSDGQSRSFD
ncbi:MAG TPA: S8 family serine peptidase [Mycobacteriales bacterium]|nr:S8 family serine peptidase [Mycobacteriales bacterium]